MTDHGEVAALRALTAGDTGAARAALAARTGRPLLNAALAGYLAATGDGRVYDRPAAFTAFIRGGGNVELYERVSAALAERYRRLGVASIVDIGCGDGRALVPALDAAGNSPAVTLVEPSAALLSAALAALAGHTDPARTTAHATDAAAFTTDLAERFDLAESTFALHAVPPAERSAVLTALRGHVGHLVLAEFDHPAHPAGGPAHLTFLADTYERGLAEYDADRDLVAQGFLMPVLTGQLAPGAPRSTWEQPAAAWAAQLEACGYREVTVEPLCDYWSSPAILLTARA
ncbi:MAG TPA: methyltransferase domain-containing protein [Actinophytocola sp.]|jgi:SAM-dependent methyltransferase|nr:methyltransferase domain-containing protein [Actinophytocola sp.]